MFATKEWTRKIQMRLIMSGHRKFVKGTEPDNAFNYH